jgi:hypothetical protein
MAAPSQAVLSYSQAAAYLGLPSVGALRMLVYNRGRAPRSLSYNERDRRFRVSDIDAWLKAKSAVAQAKQEAVPELPRKRGRPTKVEQAARRFRVT